MNIKKTLHLIRNYGFGFCVFRTQYELRKRTGLLKRKFPVQCWSAIRPSDFLKRSADYRPESFLQTHKSNGRRFFFNSADVQKLNQQFGQEVVFQADEIFHNKFQYFFNQSYDLGPAPDWFLNPVTGAKAKSHLHWCDTDFFDPAVGDIKFIWEPSRFAWVYTLVRAYAATGNERYAEKFWTLFESWLAVNEPNVGPNYACGQECAIRLMAMCFAFYALSQARSSTIKRQIKLIVAIAVHAERIEKNIDFAISTRTNHSLTEAAGLYTVGMLFPEFKSSDHWFKLGKKVLIKEGRKQIYPDGSYIQHSMNYHRLMLQDFLWVLRLAQLNNDSFCKELLSRVKKAADFLYQMQDGYDGRVPNYGANDGALILPLNNCNYLDYRPTLQAINYLFNNTRLYESGPWDEDLVWLFGPATVQAGKETTQQKSQKYDYGGYYTIRNTDSWAMIRCHSHKNRPGHADMLHLDLWWKGRNILRDSGSYMYNCEQPWQDYFRSTSAHNTITIDGNDQMQKLSRFMWFDWTRSKLVTYKNFNADTIKIIQGEHYSYRKKYNIIHRRGVLSLPDCFWLTVDDIIGTGNHKVNAFWQLCDVDYQLQGNTVILQTNTGPVCLMVLDSSTRGKCECIRGNEGPAGWQSLYYGDRQPAPVLRYSVQTNLPVRLITLVGLGGIIKNAMFNDDEMLSWSPEVSGQKHIVTLNSIKNSHGNTFVSVERAADKIMLH